MNKLLFLLISLIAGCLCSFGQTSNEKMLYIVDSIPVINDPEQGNDMQEKDVAGLIVIRNKDSLKQMGYQQFGGVICIFTKAYRDRPDSIKRIPSSKQMTPAEDTWSFRNMPYTGPFIDYYYSGKKQREGRMLNGKLTGRHTFFYQNGNIAAEREYEDGNPKSKENDQAGDRKAAIKYCTKVIGLDSTYADAYFSRGTLKLNDLQFDEAIADFDKALTIEPFMEIALANRAFAGIRKHQFGNSRQLSKNSEAVLSLMLGRAL